MRFIPLVSALIFFSGCGAPPLREEPAKPPPPNHGDAIPDAPPPQDDIVAFIDKEPVRLREVIDHAMAARGKELIDKYILWKLRKDKIEELGIVNTPEDLRKRAELIVSAYRKKVGEEQFKKDIAARGMTESAYLDTFVKNAEFDEHVKTEKAVTFALLTEPSIEIDTVAFTDQSEATAFTLLCGKVTFPVAVERLQTAPDVRGKVGYWPRHRFPQGLAPDVIASSPELEKKLFAMKKGQTSGVETAKNMLVVIYIVETHPGVATSFASMHDRIVAEILRQPPSNDQLALWLDRLFKAKRITYHEDRNSPRNQGR